MATDEALRPQADNLARLLADRRGTELLAELQKLSLLALFGDPEPAGCSPPACGPPADETSIECWQLERLPEGVALRQHPLSSTESWMWAQAPYVPPPAGACRVVLIGESTARGYPVDPMNNPAAALGRQLEAAAPGGYQCVDLAKSGATMEEATDLVGRLPLLEPDVLVAYAGNNWVFPPGTPDVEQLDDLAETLRTDGYPGLRRRYIAEVLLPRVGRFLDELLALHGTRLVIVVPEFNLRDWPSADGIEVPVLPAGPFARWYELRAAATRAEAEQRWSDVESLASEMCRLDGGTSPVPGNLTARAAIARGDGAAARAGLEQARDAVVGLGVHHTPRVLREFQQLLVDFAAGNGLRCVDTRTLLGSADLPELPDDRYFFDYCHLSDEGIERVGAAIADAVLEQPPGTATAGPGLPPTGRAVVHLLAAAQGGVLGRPADGIERHLRSAVAADTQVGTVVTALHDVLEGSGPLWVHRAAELLTGEQYGARRSASAIFGPMLVGGSRPPESWTLRECLGALLGRTPPADPPAVDLLRTSARTDHRAWAFIPAPAHCKVSAELSTLTFAAARPRHRVLELTYRTPAATPGTATEVTLNDTPIGNLPAARHWLRAVIELPTGAIRPGVNRIQFRWPVPTVDAERQLAIDAAALARGEFPFVLPVFGELFDARLADGADPADRG